MEKEVLKGVGLYDDLYRPLRAEQAAQGAPTC